MTLKTLTHPETGHTFKMGRIRPRTRHYGLRLGNYVDPMKIDLPQSTARAANAMPCLNQVMMNDVLSDCTAAASFHIEGLLQANAGRPQQKFANTQVGAFYSATTGYVEGKPDTDQGGDVATVLNYWRDHQLYKGGHRIVGHATIDATRWDLVRSAIYLFSNVYFGVSLPDAWVNPMPAGPGWTWDVEGSPDDQNGHAFAGVDYDGDDVVIASWGMLGYLTKEAVARYAVANAGGELHVVFSEDEISAATKKAPNGFAAAELAADFQKFALA